MDVGGFAILQARGVTRRANSVVPIDVPDDPTALAAAVGRIEGLCRAGDLPLRFRLMPEHGHGPVDELLAARGYETEAPCDLLEFPLAGNGKLPAPDPRARIETGPLPEDWFDNSWRLSPRDGDGARETMHDILAGTPAVHVSLIDGDGTGGTTDSPVAVGRAALADHHRTRAAVLNQIAVAPDRRREGLGSAVVKTLLAASAVQGADRALLEVELDNPGARALYTKLGFRRLGGYHYRVVAD
jgi:ribosomal protein S18 acetylase RimI-like enzyme